MSTDLNLLRRNLRNWHAGVRRAAAEALGERSEPEAVAALIEALGDSNPGVRRAIIAALGRSGQAEAVPPLVEMLSDIGPDLRQAVISALIQIGGPAIPLVRKKLLSAEPLARASAAEILGRLRVLAAGPDLLEALTDVYWEVRAAAAASLGLLGDRAAVEPLLAALQDPDWAVRRAAAMALGQLKDPRALEPLRAVARRDRELLQVAEPARQAVAAIETALANLKPLTSPPAEAPFSVEEILAALPHCAPEELRQIAAAVQQLLSAGKG